MDFFSNFFSAISTKDDIENPAIQFGKYSDRNKTPEQLQKWQQAVELFKQQKYLDAYELFFQYLKDPEIENVVYNKVSSQITFELYQGSKKVHGLITPQEVSAYSQVVQFDEPNIAVMRRLLAENYYLRYCKFSKKNKTFTLQHRSATKDMHPSALYFVLKEVANVADAFDDFLIADFPFLKPINIGKVEQLSQNELYIKIKYLKKYTQETLKQINSLPANNFKGAISFMLLNLTYKIYYLFAPEGTLLEYLKNTQNFFWSQKDLPEEQRNAKMQDDLQKMLQFTDDDIAKSLYKVTSTFPVAQPTGVAKLKELMETEIEKIHWYRENKYFEIHQSICEYIVSYASFAYGLEPVVNDLLQVFWKVTNYDYFAELGFKDDYMKNGKIMRHNVEKRINKIISSNKSAYPKLNFNTRRLNFSATNEFASSFIYEFINCDFDTRK